MAKITPTHINPERQTGDMDVTGGVGNTGKHKGGIKTVIYLNLKAECDLTNIRLFVSLVPVTKCDISSPFAVFSHNAR